MVIEQICVYFVFVFEGVLLTLDDFDMPHDLNVASHYANMPMQYTEIFTTVKISNFQLKFFNNFRFLLKT